MKKLLAFSIVFVLVCATVFAEVTVTAGAGMSFVPVGVLLPDEGDAEFVAGFGRNGAGDNELQVNVEGKTENGKAGFLFQWRPRITGTALSNNLGDNGYIWYKPLDWIKIDAGRFRIADLRGKVGHAAWFGDYTISRADEDAIFQRFDGEGAVLLEVKPEAVSGLSVYAHINKLAYYDAAQKINNTWIASRSAGYVWENIQFAVGYELPNIGLVRAQYVGAHPGMTTTSVSIPAGSGGSNIDVDLPTGWTNSRIELAFAYTGLPGLTLDVGGGFFLPFEDAKDAPNVYSKPASKLVEGKFSPGFKAGLGVKYAADPLTVNLILGGTFAQTYEDEMFGEDVKATLGFRLKPYLAVAYKLNDIFTAQLEGGVEFVGDTTVDAGDQGDWTGDGAMNYGFGLGLQTTFAPGCTIRTGLTYAGGEAPGSIPFMADSPSSKLTGAFQIPIVFAVAF
jgi:hypothetical protein